MNMLLPATLAFIVSFLATPLTIRLAKKFGFVDDPGKHKHPAILHSLPIPRSGGLPILLALALSLLFLPIEPRLALILAGAAVVVVLGTLDDKYDLNPYLRLAIMFFAASLPVLGGVAINYVTNPVDGIIRFDQFIWNFEFFGQHAIPILADLLAIFWIVWVMNAISWSSGVDGQMTGVTAIAAVTLSLVSLKSLSIDPTQGMVVVLAFITAGAYLGFLPYSIYPQKIMPGFGGATLAGYLLAVLAILSGGRVATALLVLAVPLLDSLWAIYRRTASGKSPVWGDRGHFHHQLLDLGFTKRGVAFFYWGLAASLGMAALSLDSRGKLFAGILVILAGIAAVVTVRAILGRKETHVN